MEYRSLDNTEYDDIASRIVYEDNHLLVFDKKAGEIVQGDKTGDEALSETLKAFIAMRDAKPGKVFMGVPHRLDRPVCGLCIFAKTSKALERLNAMFRDGDVHKKYLALCCSAPTEPEGLLEDWMERNERLNKSFITRKPGPKAKLARLRYRHIADTERYHLLEVELLTGRHHQIRCQLSHMGSRAISSTAPHVPIRTEVYAFRPTASGSFILSGRMNFVLWQPYLNRGNFRTGLLKPETGKHIGRRFVHEHLETHIICYL